MHRFMIVTSLFACAILGLSGCAEMQSTGLTDVLVKSLTSQLNVTADQAKGGVGSTLSLAKEKLNGADFSSLTKYIPGSDTYMKAAKDLGAVTGPIKDQAGLTSAFSRLGMGQDMVPKFSQTLSDYVGKAGGEQAKNMLAAVMR
ncbi:MAG: hypothetical protein GDA67_06600 [Nitrospira sp. CR1.3]|nr:hypothetical protein [Nitrospira sp. CR1.3]